MDDDSSMKRRLAAILAADIAGYSRLMGEDEAVTVRDLKGHQAVILPLVGRYGGRIIDTAGDGILAEFPSVINATECAVEIQTIMATRNEGVPESRARASASASTWATSSMTRPDLGTASTSRPGSRESRSPAASALPSVFDQVSRALKADFQAWRLAEEHRAAGGRLRDRALRSRRPTRA